MARSEYIYIVRTKHAGRGNVLAAFTVKRECLHWLNNSLPGYITYHEILVERLSDGARRPLSRFQWEVKCERQESGDWALVLDKPHEETHEGSD
jgi:hypothetical protein